MKNFVLLAISIFFSIVVLSCKKEEPLEYNHIANLAPCPATEYIYIIDTIIYGPTPKFPDAPFHLIFTENNREIAFNKVPTTGMYQMLTQINPTYSIENQIAIVQDSGSFLRRSAPTLFPEIYIENYDNELIISYCDISNNEFVFNSTIQSYMGNGPDSVRIRMNY